LAAAVGTGDIEMVDKARLEVVVSSLMEAAEDTLARLGQQYDAVSRRALESCDDSEYNQWEARANKVLAQRSLEQGWLSYLRAQRPVVDRAGSSASGAPSPEQARDAPRAAAAAVEAPKQQGADGGKGGKNGKGGAGKGGGGN
jgi:hypothetical protein